MEGQVFMGNNSSKDVNWLCSLSEAELDFLIGLKKFAQKHGKVIGHESLGKKIDLKKLRAYASSIKQFGKGTPKDFQTTEAGPSKEVLDGCNLFGIELGV
uniref:Uncharacterized protein n=1 Tax=Opuntia streptacantha TaxID=393608 RepID=A0A7C8ZH05_OPUST